MKTGTRMLSALIRIALLPCLCFFLALAPNGSSAEPRAGATTYSLGFSDFTGGPVLKWLEKKGFVPKQDAATESKIQFSIADEALILQAKKRALGLLLRETNVVGYSKIRIEWGVDMFPMGASYEKGIRSDGVMVYIFFGDEKLSSGSFLIPDSPYFIGLFLCQSDPVGHPYQGRYFHAGGRYVCADQTKAGETVTTDFSIADAFKRYFDKSESPFISGLGIAIDTEAAKGTGVAKSYIRTIEFLK
jgi:hypothetical protein